MCWHDVRVGEIGTRISEAQEVRSCIVDERDAGRATGERGDRTMVGEMSMDVTWSKRRASRSTVDRHRSRSRPPRRREPELLQVGQQIGDLCLTGREELLRHPPPALLVGFAQDGPERVNLRQLLPGRADFASGAFSETSCGAGLGAGLNPRRTRSTIVVTAAHLPPDRALPLVHGFLSRSCLASLGHSPGRPASRP